MHALEINNQKDFFSHVSGHRFGTYALSKEGKDSLISLAEKLKVLKPKEDSSMRYRWEFWTELRRPTREEYIEYHFDEDLNDETQKETLAGYWEEDYPDENVWYKITVIEDHAIKEKSFYGVFVNNDYVLSIGDPNELRSWAPTDAQELLSWLHESADETIEKVRSGTYNEWIEKNLPYKYRTGTILRKDYYDAYPCERASFRAGLTAAEIEEFCKKAKEKPEDNKVKYMPQMTARMFFEACAIGYKAADYEERHLRLFTDTEEEKERYDGLTPRELYSIYADGRDDNLTHIPLDDPNIFSAWCDGDERYCIFNGHHACEVVGRFSISHSIHLYPMQTEDGWYFALSGDAQRTSTEIVKWLNAISKKYTIFLLNGDALVARYEETDRIAILPANEPVLWGDNYSERVGHGILDAINLPEGYEKILNKIEWLPQMRLEFADINSRRNGSVMPPTGDYVDRWLP